MSRPGSVASMPDPPRLVNQTEDLGVKTSGAKVDFPTVMNRMNRAIRTAGEHDDPDRFRVAAISQTCGPEVVLAGELEFPYGLVGFPVNYAIGIARPEPEEELSSLLALSTKVLPRLVLRTVGLLEEKNLTFDHGYMYRVEGEIG